MKNNSKAKALVLDVIFAIVAAMTNVRILQTQEDKR